MRGGGTSAGECHASPQHPPGWLARQRGSSAAAAQAAAAAQKEAKQAAGRAWMASRFVEPLRRSTASTASSAKCSFSGDGRWDTERSCAGGASRVGLHGAGAAARVPAPSAGCRRRRRPPLPTVLPSDCNPLFSHPRSAPCVRILLLSVVLAMLIRSRRKACRLQQPGRQNGTTNAATNAPQLMPTPAGTAAAQARTRTAAAACRR